ncbi:MAG: type IV pilus twitching motility protein PilT [Gemmatimonadaceae bacterium]|nr:type IV pilus twitching motility protein PilT [Gemmatimonadaceae bacterium]
MASLDKFLMALGTAPPTTLVLYEGAAAELRFDGGTRPITKQALSAEQIVGLLREIAPAALQAAVMAGGPARFAYDGSGIPVDCAIQRDADGRVVAQILPASSADAALREEASVAKATPVLDSGPRQALDALLRALAAQKGSDLHLRVGEPPIVRRDGELVRIGGAAPLGGEQLEQMLLASMPERNREEFLARNDTDFAIDIPGVARFRGNALRDRCGAAAVFRLIPSTIITAEQLGLSEFEKALCNLSKGLVLVTGPTGSGKSTTLCGMIDLVNRSRTDHIITIEDPIEFVHASKKCIITQRQVGVHTGSFKTALRAALREDPDVILVGELRDLETIECAIETAETGHLVFGTLHTTTAPSTVDRLIDQFPADRQAQIRTMLSESLKGVISQTLVKKKGGGRAAAREVLLANTAVSNLIREGKTFQIPTVMQTSKKLGMVTMTDALLDLVEKDLVDPNDAWIKAVDKGGFQQALQARGITLDRVSAAA